MVSTITIIFLYLVITTINRFTFEVTVDIYQLLYQYGSQLQSTPYIGQCFQQGAHNIGLRGGPPHPLRAYYDGHGINFALYLEYVTKI
ncbi:unnamed protein product [Rotaria sordida]|uniref:Uncharacterized protein n=2 Tax=Rotaria sordida TaxID=392033 RepID=A0A815JQ76_9BILA|nr:unnamed protein product [Rotaria sordida]CAF3736518.1 unnamed protein product [Rotaria sordida]CAF4073691.1 unnamed protein product [Rotaria sordida]